MRKILNSLYIVAFFGILLIPTLKINRQEGAISTIDNRMLADAPELWSSGFTSSLESYVGDRIGFRNEMISGYQALNDVVAGELVHPNYAYGKDGYIFAKMKDNQQFDDFKITFAEMVIKVKDYCESRGSNFYFMFEPEKTSVYRQYLPDGVNYNDEWADELIAYLEERGVTCINNKQLLIEKSQTEQVFNRQYDAGHWNALGCFYATNNLLSHIHEDYSEVNPYELGDFTISETVEPYLPNSEFVINEAVPAFTLNTPITNVGDAYQNEMERNTSFTAVYNYINEGKNSGTLPKTLIFQGSYYNKFPEFMAGWASEYTGVHNYQNVLSVDYYYNIVQPDIVVFEVAEYTVLTNYFDYDTMLQRDYNPAISAETYIEKYTLNQLEQYSSGSEVEISEGEKIDRVYIYGDYSSVQNAYLIVDDVAFDLRIIDGSTLWADVSHGAVQNGKQVLLLTKDCDGNEKVEKIP